MARMETRPTEAPLIPVGRVSYPTLPIPDAYGNAPYSLMIFTKKRLYKVFFAPYTALLILRI